jgi:uncharacterized protein (DUF849 family)
MMNPYCAAIAVLALTLLFGAAGCGKKTGVNNELERAVKAVATEAGPETVQTDPAAPQTAAQQVEQATASFKAGDYSDAVTRMSTVLVQGSNGKMPMTPQQYMAVQDAAGAMLSDLYVRASTGDAKAQQAIENYNRLKPTR